MRMIVGDGHNHLATRLERPGVRRVFPELSFELAEDPIRCDRLQQVVRSVVGRSHVLKKGLNLFAQSIARLYLAHDSVISFLPNVGAKGFLENSFGRYFTRSLFAENLGHYPYIEGGGIWKRCDRCWSGPGNPRVRKMIE